MFTKKVVVTNETGLHARPASELVKTCKQYESKITLVVEKEKGPMNIDAKSILMVLSGGMSKGTELELQVEGADEDVAGPAIAEFIENLED